MSHTPTPWFVSGVRFKMNCREWHNVNRYDESKKQDENIACVGYDPRTGLGLADAHFIVKAVNAHDELAEAVELLLTCVYAGYAPGNPTSDEAISKGQAALVKAGAL